MTAADPQPPVLAVVVLFGTGKIAPTWIERSWFPPAPSTPVRRMWYEEPLELPTESFGPHSSSLAA